MLTIEPTGAVLGATVRGLTWRSRSTKATWGASSWHSAGTGCSASRTSISTLRR